MIEIRNLTLPLDSGLPGNESSMKTAAARKLKIAEKEIIGLRVLRRSVDARKKSDVHFVATLGIDLAVDEGQIIERAASNDVIRYEAPESLPLTELRTSPQPRPIVVGSGPAGLFAAYLLARSGARPLVVERGDSVEKRALAVKSFMSGGDLDTSSNIQFGEGGAGTFSDGKLTSNISSPRCRSVLEVFAACGASPDILWQSKPHIGTDVLVRVVKTLRENIIGLGGEFRFNSQLTDLVLKDGHLRAAILDGSEEVEAEVLILASGHSARDTFEMIHTVGVHLEQKSFSLGVRVEHLQSAIDEAQYGRAAGHPALGASDYKLACHLPNGRGVYTFCMCPGGEVIAATSEIGAVVTNGMSCFARDGMNANAAFLVGVGPSDFGSAHPLAGVEFQRLWERKAFEAGGGTYRAPAQLMGDFLRGVPSRGPGSITPTYARGVTWTDLSSCLPAFVTDALKEAAPLFNRRLKGFSVHDAVLTGIESRSSSPVRIVRDENLQSNIAGLYPCGEGAGYAGGIMSAAVDGLRVAQAVLDRYAF